MPMMPIPTQRNWAADERLERIQLAESAKVAIVVPGVELCSLVGEQSGARDLFTGLLSLGPMRSYPLYTRPVTEVFVLVSGEASVEVEDRRYRLGPLDALTIAPHVPRRVINPSASQPVMFHVALAAGVAEQTWVNGHFTAVDQPAVMTGRSGAERICRNDAASRFELATSAYFQDLFNADLGAEGICGGYGLFEPGARLPCHRHEFDESITIIQGVATCIVEGRRYELSGNATALVPQGRCHYFINLTQEQMAMIWVYAGAKPDRIVMDESFCHPDMRS